MKIIIIFTLVCNFLFQFKKISSKQISEQTEVWLHRGQEESSDLLKTFKFIEKNSWDGVELDIFFSKNDKIFYITHDYFNGSAKMLSKLNDINQFEGKKLWLDFKNLKDVELSELSKLKNQLEELGKKNFIFIESQNFLKLKILQNHKVKSIFHPPIVSDNKLFLLSLKYFTNIFNYDYISVPYKQLYLVKDFFDKGRVVTFTVNSPETLCQLLKDNYTKVVLSKTNLDKSKCKN
ncbi:MAG: hypothetical protein CMM90_04855 [Rickettsiales bacterium]|nr:hypothetical protein [Rickettsiales bacterium]